MGAIESERIRPIGVRLPANQVIAIEYVGLKDPRNLPKNRTLVEFAQGRKVYGCKTISDAVALYRKHQNLKD